MSTSVRLSAKVLDEAKTQADKKHRKLPSQVEYVTRLGLKIEDQLSGSEIDEVLSGRARVKIDRPVSLESIMESVERETRSIPELTGLKEWYVGSKDHPGLIEKHNTKGQVIIGTFKNGEFISVDGKKSKKEKRANS